MTSPRTPRRPGQSARAPTPRVSISTSAGPRLCSDVTGTPSCQRTPRRSSAVANAASSSSLASWPSPSRKRPLSKRPAKSGSSVAKPRAINRLQLRQVRWRQLAPQHLLEVREAGRIGRMRHHQRAIAAVEHRQPLSACSSSSHAGHSAIAALCQVEHRQLAQRQLGQRRQHGRGHRAGRAACRRATPRRTGSPANRRAPAARPSSARPGPPRQWLHAVSCAPRSEVDLAAAGAELLRLVVERLVGSRSPASAAPRRTRAPPA